MHYDKLMNLIIVKKVRTYGMLLTVQSKRQKKDVVSAASSGPFRLEGGALGPGVQLEATVTLHLLGFQTLGSCSHCIASINRQDHVKIHFRL